MPPSPQSTPSKKAFDRILINDISSNPFDTLPIETVQQVASHIDSDASLCNFQASCRSARDAIDSDNYSFWRRRFLTQFDPTGWSQKDNVKYKHAYHHRRNVLKHGAHFRNGRSKDERECLEVLKELILGACSEPKNSTYIEPNGNITLSNNIGRMVTFLESTNLLKNIFQPIPVTARTSSQPYANLRADPLLTTIRVLCTPIILSLNRHLINTHYGFPDTQLAVYSPATYQPFFGGPCGLDINMEFVLHNINFWRYHMVRQVEQTLYTPFSDLSEGEKPQWWRSQLEQGVETLGKYWKGSYAYLNQDELELLRSLESNDEDDVVQIQDLFAGEDAAFAFQDMELHVVPQDEKMAWPASWEHTLHSLAPPPPTSPPPSVRTRAQKKSGLGGTPEEIAAFKPRSFRFHGSGSDSEESFLASGWLNPLPPQQGIPGWRRLTMMKYFDDEDAAGIDVGALWAYEGVVLPGGRIVVGRWWSPGAGVGADDEQYSGPFVLWCVDGAEGYQGRGEGEDVLV